MKNKKTPTFWILSGLWLFLLTGAYLFFTVYQPSPKIYTVNLVNIMRAQTFLAGKSLQAGLSTKQWMSSVSHQSPLIRQSITDLVGKKAVVIVSPAVIQGAVDITDKVLVKLGLPTQLPAALMNVSGTLTPPTVSTHSIKKEAPAWLTP
jgi:hypothetical protein